MESVTDLSKAMPPEIAGFNIIRELGTGSVATVYLARQKDIGREVALKVMLPQFASDERFSSEFLRETRITAGLSHRTVVPIYAVGELERGCYLTMEYMAGGNLRNRIRQGVSVEAVLELILDIASALKYAHSKAVIHGGIKPENILFREDNSVVIGDFGLARVIHESFSESFSSSALDYSARYMSPEQALARKPDERSDIYSLGVVFYELLTGEPLYPSNTTVFAVIKSSHSKEVARLPKAMSHLQPLFEKMVARDPDDRYQNGEELVKAIKACCGKTAPEPVDDDSTVRIDMKAFLAASETHATESKTKIQETNKPEANKPEPESNPGAEPEVKPIAKPDKSPIMVPLGKVTPASPTIPGTAAPTTTDNQLTLKAKFILAGCVVSIAVMTVFLGMGGTGDVPLRFAGGSSESKTVQATPEDDTAVSIAEPDQSATHDELAQTDDPAPLNTPAPPVEEVTDVLESDPQPQQPEVVAGDSSPVDKTPAGKDSMALADTPVETDNELPASPDPEPQIEAEVSEIDMLMSQAADALYNNHLMVPLENSAYELYSAVLERDPDHAGARAGLGQIVDRYLAISSGHLNEGEFDQAEKFANRALQVAARKNVDHEYELKVEDKLIVIRRVKALKVGQSLDHWMDVLQDKERLTVSDLNNAYISYMAILDMNIQEPQIEEARDVYTAAFHDLGTRYLNNEELDTARELIAKGLQIDPQDENLRALEARWVRWHDARAWVVE